MHQPPKAAAAALVIASGAVVATQSRVNAQLAHYLGNDGVWGGALSLTIGLATLLVFMAFSPSGRHSFAELPGLVRSGQLKPWHLFGGISGAFYVALQGIVVPRTGVAPFTVASVAGQTANSTVVDRLGIAPGGKRPVTWQRVVAAILATSAVGLAVFFRPTSHAAAWWLLLLPLLSGALMAVQQAFNSRVAVMSGSTLAATLVNFIVAVGSLYFMAGVLHLLSHKAPHSPPGWSHLWLYSGGFMGAFAIFVGAMTVGTLGVLVFTLAQVVGLLSGAVLIDIIFPTPGSHVGWNTVAAVVITIGAMAMAAAGRSTPPITPGD